MRFNFTDFINFAADHVNHVNFADFINFVINFVNLFSSLFNTYKINS